MAELDGSARRVPLGGGVTLIAPGLRGEAVLSPPGLVAGTSGEPDGATAALHEALTRAGMAEAYTGLIRAVERPVTGLTGVRTSDGRAAMALEVPAAQPNQAQVVLLADEQGVLSWHYPQPPEVRSSIAPEADTDATTLFVLPREVAATSPAGGTEIVPADRALFTGIGQKVLKVLVFPLLDAWVGKAAQLIAAAWEGEHRPYRVRPFDRRTYRADEVSSLSAVQWGDLAAGRALLFVHGTFSTSRAFTGIDPDTMTKLGDRYGGRLFAFDHPTLSVDPRENAIRFADSIPSDTPLLELDIVSHSRGGLVARALAGELAEDIAPNVKVRRIVYCGTPNMGTALADPEHMAAFVDRYTALLNLLPLGPWAGVVDLMASVLEVVKIIGRGAAGSLPGLAAMDSDGDFIKSLNQAGVAGAEHFGVDANFQPTGSLAALWLLPNKIADRIFGNEHNDGVVPTVGVGNVRGDPGFPIPDDRRLNFDATRGVWHCSYFGQPEVDEALLKWLAGEAV